MQCKIRQVCVWLVLLCGSVLVVACGTPAQADQGMTALPTPTVSGMFHAATPTATALPDIKPTVVPATAVAAPAPTTQPLEEVSIFGDQVNGNWELKNSSGMSFYFAEHQVVSDGTVSAVITPTRDFGELFFTVHKKSQTVYLRERVLGVTFWLNGGPNGIRTSDLAVTVVGSNAYPYWVENDTSVTVTGRVTKDMPLFSETRLYYLGINRDIAPNTWVKVELWLDDLKFDPDYTYVTGIYIKNDAGFRGPFYIDQVNLVTMPTQ